MNLARATLLKSLYRGFIQRSCTETLHRGLRLRKETLRIDPAAEILPIESSYRDLARRPLYGDLVQDLVKRAGALLGDHLWIFFEWTGVLLFAMP